ncbi:MAG: LAGLIDADG family homing endonuclease, partial [Nanoarchaeota archaeon]|nr:LAGLIDADG family homing endonuclease [Nanoarchaeota archaeon]
YIFGLLLGDGSLPKSNDGCRKRYMINFYSNDKEFIYEIYLPLFKDLFNLVPWIELRNKKYSILYAARIESRILYEYFENIGFTTGRKAKIANLPKLPKKYHCDLLAGLLDTDGGKKGNGFGLSTASRHLGSFCEDVFSELNFNYNSCPWNYKGHIYHQIYVPGSEMHKLLSHITIKNKNKIKFIKSKLPR